MHLNSNTNLVLGADGFLGNHMTRILREQGLNVLAIGRSAGDFTDQTIVEDVFKNAPKVDRIFHLITRQRTGNVQYGIQGELLAINSRIHLNILEAWRRHQPQAKLISTGSSCVYPELDYPICEVHFQSGPMHSSVRGYGLAKQLLAVGSAAYASQYGLKYLHLFLATVYGPRDHKSPDRAHFMTGMINRAQKEKAEGKTEFTVWGDPETVRDLLYVDDQINAILAADTVFENEYINCASNTPVTIDECANAITTSLEWDAEIIYPAGTFKGTSFKTLDSKKFLNTTGWKAQINLIDGIRRVNDTNPSLG